MRSTLFLLALPVALLATACGDDAATTDQASSGTGPTTGAGANGTGGSGTGGQSTTTGGQGAAGPGGAGGAGASSSGGNGAAGGAPPALPLEPVRFVAIGDAGEGNDTQFKVAGVVETVCDQAGGCDFAIYLGDNFYDVGVEGPDDEQFETKFEQPYANLSFPFYVSMGNHDYGCLGAGCELDKGQHQIDYATQNPTSKWKLPSKYYVHSTDGMQAGIDFFALDTNEIMFGQGGDQQTWLDGATAGSTANWKIAFGHHTYVSNGQHGNAGEYEGLPFLPIVNGENVKEFFDASVCGKVDIYFCGHDHNRQWLQPTCGTEFVVSGTGAKHTDFEPKGTPTFFGEDSTAGFIFVEVLGNELTGTFYDEDGNAEFSRTVTK